MYPTNQCMYYCVRVRSHMHTYLRIDCVNCPWRHEDFRSASDIELGGGINAPLPDTPFGATTTVEMLFCSLSSFKMVQKRLLCQDMFQDFSFKCCLLHNLEL